MKVLILAAGESKRLRPLTNNHPKALLLLEEKEILHHILEICQNLGLTDFNILTGHGHDYVVESANKYKAKNPKADFNIIFNDEYQNKGNIYSLYSAKDILDDDVIVINSDTIFHKDILQSLLEHPEKNVMAVDDAKELSDEEMKVYTDEEDKQIKKINKSLDPKKSKGEYIGVLKLGGEHKDELLDSLEEIMNEDDSLYYEDGLQHLIDKGIPFHKLSTQGKPAMEIDTHEDLKTAKNLIKQIKLDI